MHFQHRRIARFLTILLALIAPKILGAQTVANGHYYGSTLLCDNGYRSEGGQCRQLASVTNGHYYGSTLLCDNGYRSEGGQCQALANTTTSVQEKTLRLTDKKTETGPTCAENGTCYGDISNITGRPKTVDVQGYYRKDGTYVRGHYRALPKKK
jgi:hypothetical protein